jgi:methylglyoxal synthase
MRFACRVSTDTTGRNLNDLAWARGWPQTRLWTECCRSGPMGGDAQIANLIFERRVIACSFLRTRTLRASTKQIFSCLNAPLLR